jgi:Tol biopolymer transport system component/DNA-binding winged helix-turn-helix (wHTH) protein
MKSPPRESFQFGEFRLVPSERQLWKNDELVALPPKAFAVLAILVENAGNLVENKTIMQQVWPDSFVEDANIQVQVSRIRKALAEGGAVDLIETVPKTGYRFVGPVTNSYIESAQNGNSQSEVPDIPQPPPETQVHSGFKRSRPLFLYAAAASLLLLIGSAYGIYLLWGGGLSNSGSSAFPGPLEITKLTSSGASLGGAISPDGKYVAYQTISGGKYSIWLMKLDDRTSVEIVPSAESPVNGLTFSPSDDHIYYTAVHPSRNKDRSIYKISRLGGEPVLVVPDVQSPVAFSPDGSSIAFVRKQMPEGTAVFVASRDGSDERQLAARIAPNSFSTGKRPAFSPDGNSVAVVGVNEGERFQRVLRIDTSSGAVTNLTEENWPSISDMAWAADGKSLLIVAQDDANFGPHQLWSFSIAAGKAEKITREIVNYTGLGVDAARERFLSTQNDGIGQLWLIGGKEAKTAELITSLKGMGRVEMAWLSNERIVFSSSITGQADVHSIALDGSGPEQLTADAFIEHSLTVSPDGKYIAYVSNRNGADNLWLMRSDGSDQKQLGNDTVFRQPLFSPDGKWVIYATRQNGKTIVWKIPSAGGEPQLLLEGSQHVPNISPDLKLMAYFKKDGKGQSLIEIASFPDGRVVASIAVPADTQPSTIAWSPDGKAVIYRGTAGKIMNFWMHRLVDKEARPMTNFTEDAPIDCVPSPDMSRTVCLGATSIRDIVLFSVKR